MGGHQFPLCFGCGIGRKPWQTGASGFRQYQNVTSNTESEDDVIAYLAGSLPKADGGHSDGK